MKKIITIFMILFFSSAAHSEDKTIWLEPGVSAGPVRLGDNRANVIKMFGLPNKIDQGIPIMYDMTYEDFFIEMSATDDMKRRLENMRKGFENEKKALEATVLRITSYSPYSKTRGNIGIGSSLPEVLNVFGDTSHKVIRQEPLKAVICSTAWIFKYPENRLSSLKDEQYNGHMLEVDYFQEGIQFIFKLDDGLPKVFAIRISQRDECKVKVDSERGYIDVH